MRFFQKSIVLLFIIAIETKAVVSDKKHDEHKSKLIVDKQRQMKPTSAPSFPTWRMDDAVILDFLGDRSSPRMAVTHNIGTADSKLETFLYESDCMTTVPSEDAVGLKNANLDRNMGVITYDITLNTDPPVLGKSAVLVEGQNLLQFCVEAGLSAVNSVIDYGVIMSKTYKVDIGFRMDVDVFEAITIDTQGAEAGSQAPGAPGAGIDSVDLNIGLSSGFYSFTACVCNLSPDSCDEYTEEGIPPMPENSGVSICLSNSPGIELKDFLMSITRDDGSFSYEIVSVENGEQSMPPFTNIQYIGDVTRVNTQLLTGLFDVGREGSATISGSASFQFSNNNSNAKEQDSAVQEYSMWISLVGGESSNNVECLFGAILTAFGL